MFSDEYVRRRQSASSSTDSDSEDEQVYKRTSRYVRKRSRSPLDSHELPELRRLTKTSDHLEWLSEQPLASSGDDSVSPTESDNDLGGHYYNDDYRKERDRLQGDYSRDQVRNRRIGEEPCGTGSSRNHKQYNDNDRRKENNLQQNESRNDRNVRVDSGNHKSEHCREISPQAIHHGQRIGFGMKNTEVSETKTKPKTKMTVANAFADSDDEEEVIPDEAKMRMRNIGRMTATSSGPNSYGKTNKGFTIRKYIPDDKEFNHIK